ncbi:nuclear receptor corepressor 2, partial [Rhizopus stolonifer]
SSNSSSSRYTPYYREDMHYSHYSKSLNLPRREEKNGSTKDNVPSYRYPDWREQRYMDRRDYDNRRYMRYDVPSYKSFNRDDRDYYKRSLDYDRYRSPAVNSSSSSSRGGGRRPGWRLPVDDKVGKPVYSKPKDTANQPLQEKPVISEQSEQKPFLDHPKSEQQKPEQQKPEQQKPEQERSEQEKLEQQEIPKQEKFEQQEKLEQKKHEQENSKQEKHDKETPSEQDEQTVHTKEPHLLIEQSGPKEEEMTQDDIVERIDYVENEISRLEEMLQAKNTQENQDQQQPETVDLPVKDRPQLLGNLMRASSDPDEKLYEQIILNNQKMTMQSSDNEPRVYKSLQDYACYQENTRDFDQLRMKVVNCLHIQDITLKKKKRILKKEFKTLYAQWKKKNLVLDRIRQNEQNKLEKYYRGSLSNIKREEIQNYVDNVIFIAGAPDSLNFSHNEASTYDNLYTSDTVRSEAQLMEMIQKIETLEMRNPESRAKRTTATIPPMILDSRERSRKFDDRSGLVKDPLSYYHTGPNTEDAWNQQEVTAFIKSYIMYPKQFERISRDVGTKTTPQCVLFYYRKKKKIDFKMLLKKGKRAKTSKHRDKMAAAAVLMGTGESRPSRKSKGSALMADLGQVKSSRKTLDDERKSKELRDLEQDNSYWDSAAERKRSKRMSTPIIGPLDPSDMLQESKRRSLNKSRSSRESVQLTTSIYFEEEKNNTNPSAKKWTEDEKETATEAFKQCGRDFPHVSSLLPCKTEEQVRNFYHNTKRKNGPNIFNEENMADEEVSTSQMDTSGDDIALRSFTPPLQPSPGGGIAISHRRQRVRTMSGRTKDTMDDDWTDGDYVTKSSVNRKMGRTTSLTDKRFSYYWSVTEREEFLKYLEMYGCNWEKITNAMKTKTVIQVRNFYYNNEDKMQLKDITNRFYSSQVKNSESENTQRYPPHIMSFSSENPSPQSKASAVTKVADLLNNDEPPEAHQNSWETWFGS